MSLSEVKIDRGALHRNLRGLRSLAVGAELCAVVKGNAYGHGLEAIVPEADGLVDAFQVDDLCELLALRRLTEKRALVLGYLSAGEAAEAVRLGAEVAIFDREHAEMVGSELRAAGLEGTVHVKVDALLGRLGTLPEKISEVFDEMAHWPELKVESVYAHYANIEDTTDLTHAEAQEFALRLVEGQLRTRGMVVRSHLSATSGLITMEPRHRRSLVRVGIGIYGLYPSRALERSHSLLGLRPVMSWVSRLAQAKWLPARHPVGYGLTYVTAKPTRIGIVPQGYSDGYDRGLSNLGHVLICGRPCAVLGRVAMNMFAVDLTDCPDAERESEVVLIGGQGSESISAEDLAIQLGTISYEVTSRICPLLPRTVVG